MGGNDRTPERGYHVCQSEDRTVSVGSPVGSESVSILCWMMLDGFMSQKVSNLLMQVGGGVYSYSTCMRYTFRLPSQGKWWVYRMAWGILLDHHTIFLRGVGYSAWYTSLL